MNRKVSIRIHYRRRSDLVVLLSLVLLTAAFLGYLAWGQKEVAASGPQATLLVTTGMRQYYLTISHVAGANASTACASGYHMASLWEIVDPSNLLYNTTLGWTRADSGAGPTTFRGWVRTGYSAYSSNTAGRANCNAWTTSNSGLYGTTAALPNTWDAGWQDLHVWNVQTYECDDTNYVWCVADDITTWIYLPLILRNDS